MSDKRYVDKPCQLCGSTEEVGIFCGGPVAFLCKGCHEILLKYFEYRDRWEEVHKRRRFEVGSQIFFRKTFDDDPVKYIWG